MQNLTLDQMIQETATYIDEEIGNAPYTGDIAKVTNKIISGLNVAYMKICAEKYRLLKKENVTLDSNKQFDINNLSKTFFEFEKITSSDGVNLDFNLEDTTTVIVPNASTNGIVTVYYFYTPTELVNLTDKIELPNGAIDNKILCYYAAYHYLNIEIDSMAPNWLALFNEGFDSIRQYKGATNQVSNRLGW